MNRITLRTNLMLVGAFALGAIAGGFGFRAYEQHTFAKQIGGSPSQARTEFRIRAMTAELDLSADQQERIRQIYAAHQGEIKTAIHKCAPEVKVLKEGIDAEIRLVLDPAQQAKHDAIVDRKR